MTLSPEERCDCTVIHHDIVEAVRAALPDEETVYDVSELFRIFGDSSRCRIICALCQSEMCVCDLAALLSLSQSAVSHQLRILKQARLVRSRRAGKVVYYSLHDAHVKDLFKIAFDHITE